MKKAYILIALIVLLSASACVQPVSPQPTPIPPQATDPQPTNTPAVELPTQEPQPTAEPEIPAVNLYAYVRDYWVFVFNPADNSVFHMGDSAHPFGYPSDCLQNSPRFSLDGHYLAFEARCANSFIVYDLTQNMKVAEIAKVSSPEILGDTLLGWAENGRLYYTRMVGGCSFDPELKGPERIEVYSYEPSSGGTRYEFDLPKVNDAPHAYSIGIIIDPQAEHVIGWNAACSVGLGTRFLFNVPAGTFEIEPAIWPASFGDISGNYSAFPVEQYVFGADGGKLYVQKDPALEWDPNARLMFLALGAANPVQIDSGSISELVSQAPLVK